MNLQDAKQIVPNLATSLTGPLLALEKSFLDRQVEIEVWFRKAWIATPAPIQCSVDLRNSGSKLAPVDTNLFPGGFNNLSEDSWPLCIQAIQATFSARFPGCEKILLIPENHTRNLFYLENVATLKALLQKAGFRVELGSLLENMNEPLSIELPSKRQIVLHPLLRRGDKVYLDNFTPCMVMLNNDLAEGIPPQLQGIHQTIHPPLKLGWSHRLKSDHFRLYQQVAEQFAKDIGIDSWYINPIFDTAENIDFGVKADLQIIADKTDALLTLIKQHYQQRQINAKPFVVVKSDSGTYGMGVLPVTDASQILALNRKARSKMATNKGKGAVDKVIIQEGIPTSETIGEAAAVAEPVVYMLGQHVVGGFYRIHKDKREHENLNSPGMHFQPLAFNQPCNNPDANQSPDASPNRFYAYGVVARLALLAAAHELQLVSGDTENDN